MKISQTQRIPDIIVDPAVSARGLLSVFRSVCPSIRSSKVALITKKKITVEIVRFDAWHMLDSALCALRDRCDRRFLDPYELLFLDQHQPQLQMNDPVATHQFVLGVHPEDVPSCASRDHFGRVVEEAESWRTYSMPPTTWYATVCHVTDVDRINVEAPEGTTAYEQWLNKNMPRMIDARLLLEG